MRGRKARKLPEKLTTDDTDCRIFIDRNVLELVRLGEQPPRLDRPQSYRPIQSSTLHPLEPSLPAKTFVVRAACQSTLATVVFRPTPSLRLESHLDGQTRHSARQCDSRKPGPNPCRRP